MDIVKAGSGGLNAPPRLYDGVHYRNSTVVGNELGMKVGDLVQQKFAR